MVQQCAKHSNAWGKTPLQMSAFKLVTWLKWYLSTLLCTSKFTLGRHVYSWESGKLSFWFLLYFQNLYAVKWDWFDADEFTAFQTPFSHKKLHRIDLILPSCHLLETSRIKRTFSTMKLRFGMNQQLKKKPQEPGPFHNIFTQKQYQLDTKHELFDLFVIHK